MALDYLNRFITLVFPFFVVIFVLGMGLALSPNTNVGSPSLRAFLSNVLEIIMPNEGLGLPE